MASRHWFRRYRFKTIPKALSTLSQKSATVAVFCDSLTFLRQCGQGLSNPKSLILTLMLNPTLILTIIQTR